MSNAELKLKLVKLISDFEDQNLLEEVFELLTNAVGNPRKDWWDDLSDLHLARLESSIQDYKAGRTLTHDEVKNNIDRWLSK